MPVDIDGRNHRAHQWKGRRLQRNDDGNISNWGRFHLESAKEKKIVCGQVYD